MDQHQFLIAEKHVNSSPRQQNVLRAAKAEGILNRWTYRSHFEALLSRHQATHNQNCFGVAEAERTYFKKSGVVRYVLEKLDRGFSPRIGVFRLIGAPRISDSKELVLDFQLGLGAYGGTLETYPIPGMPHNYGIVKIQDLESVTRYFNNYRRRSKTSRGSEYTVFAEFHHDDFIGPILTTTEANFKLATRAPFVEPDPRSNFIHRPDWREQQAAVSREADQLERIKQELAELRKQVGGQ